MGKTRLLRWLEREAQGQGFQVLWGNGLKEAVAPFFVFEQIFRKGSGSGPGGTPRGSRATVRSEALPAFLLYEEERPRQLRQTLIDLSPSVPILLASRDSPSTLRDRGLRTGEGCSTLWITRMEGEGRVSPGDLDVIGERISQHLRGHPGSVVALDGLEYLCSQSSFSPVLRLLQFVRDVAQETDGHLLVSANPSAFDKREISLIEADAEVERPSLGGAPEAASKASGAETASETLLRYLRQLEGMARQGPQLLVVDDLHWADAQSGLAFQFLARNSRDLPVVLVGGAREEEISHQADDQGFSLSDRMKGLETEGRLERLPLSPFGMAEARELARDVLKAPLGTGHREEEALRELLRRTGGNPYFLQETLLQLWEDGALQEGEQGLHFLPSRGARDMVAGVPTSLRRLVLQRFATLSREERVLLDTSAVAGSEFTLEPIAGVRGLPLGEARSALRALALRRRLVEETGADGTAWSFSHPLVWEVLIAEMSLTSRRQYASSLLTWWEEHRPDDIPALARLAHEAGDSVRGLPWVREALSNALSSFAPEAAATYLGWMRDLRWGGGERANRDRVMEELRAARTLARSGGARDGRRIIEGILGEGLPEELAWEARYSLAVAMDVLDSEESYRIVRALHHELSRKGPQVPVSVRLEVNSALAEHLSRHGKPAEALALIQPVLAASQADMEADVWFRSTVHAVWVLNSLGKRAEAQELLEKAKRSTDSDPRNMVAVQNCISIMAISQGTDPEAGIASSKESARLYRLQGAMLSAGIADYNAAEIMIDIGRYEEAEATARELLEIGRKFDLLRLRCSGNFLLARAEQRRGRWKEALPIAEQALREAEESQRVDDVHDCRLLLIDLRGEAGEIDRALEEFDALEREGAFSSMPRVCDNFPIRAALFLKKGETERAREMAQRALHAAEQLGNAKVDARMRKFLAALPSAPSTSSAGSGNIPRP